jgi:hypothetical protein
MKEIFGWGSINNWITIKAAIILLFLGSSNYLQTQTIILDGDVSGEWKIDDSPFIIQGNIHVPPQGKLSIDAGVEILFQGSYSLEIEGKIEAMGNYNDSITFTLLDSTGFSQGNTTGWYGLAFTGYNYSFSENSVLNYCTIECSEMNGLTCTSYPYLLISNSTIRNNKSTGLVLYQFSDIAADNIRICDNYQGGLVAVYSSPIISNFSINGNTGTGASLYGNSSGSQVTTFINGKLINNAGFMNGGGLSLGDDSQLLMDNVIISNNSAIYGGGIYCGIASGVFNNLTLTHNEANFGGGIYCSDGANVEMEYSLIARNTAMQSGGGIMIKESSINLTNCTLSGNSSSGNGGGLFFDLSFPVQNTINSSIVWDNQPDEIDYTNITPDVVYSDVKGGFTGMDNFDSDPLFVDPVMSDYHLQWSGFPDENGLKSPCIDAGNPETEPDPDGTINDVGAFYFDQSIFTAIDHNNAFDEVTIYPNPAQNFISVRGIEKYDRIKIFSISGSLVLDEKMNSELNQIDISSLIDGIYILNLYQGEEFIGMKKIVKD